MCVYRVRVRAWMNECASVYASVCVGLPIPEFKYLFHHSHGSFTRNSGRVSLLFARYNRIENFHFFRYTSSSRRITTKPSPLSAIAKNTDTHIWLRTTFYLNTFNYTTVGLVRECKTVLLFERRSANWLLCSPNTLRTVECRTM